MVIKTPSLYSQDDPLAEALRPPSFETDAERYARVQAEADAKRISEQIDEDLRQERERLRRKRADVKVSFSLNVAVRLADDRLHSSSSSARQRAANQRSRNSSS